MAGEFNFPRDKIDTVFVGSNNKLFPPAESIPQDMPFRVLQFGTYIPLHGLDTIIRAAKILEKDKEIKFKVVGRGQLEEEIKGLAKDLESANLEFSDWVPVEELYRLIADSHVCLGIFGTTEKTKRVIPSKAFDTLAVGTPLVSGDTPAMREAFTNKENILIVPLNDHEALAKAILELKEDPELRKKIATGGHKLYRDIFTPEALGKQFIEVLKKHFKKKFQSGS
jgi:glycosyltransferase involved in cell wall biosynthesis